MAKRDKLLMEFMWELGGRISDIIGLKTDDIDFSKKIITLVKLKNFPFTLYFLMKLEISRRRESDTGILLMNPCLFLTTRVIIFFLK